MAEFEIENGILVKYTGSDAAVVIPDGVTAIGDGVFRWHDKLKKITIPNGVQSIGESAFNGCSALKRVHLPDGVLIIGENAFSSCYRLEHIYIPDSVTDIGPGAFIACRSLKEIRFPSGIKNIGHHTFQECSNLKSFIIPNGVTEIGKQAFHSCSELESILIPEGVKHIGDSAFSDCMSIESIVIPDGVASIGEKAFEDCSDLGELILPGSVKHIGDCAFLGCSRLKTIRVDERNTVYYAEGNCLIRRRSETLIAGCAGSVIPEGVRHIEKEAFSGCTGLEHILIPDSVKTIAQYAFRACTALEDITIPESVISIGDWAFYGCINLKSITIPASVQKLGEHMLDDCGALCEIHTAVKLKDIRCFHEIDHPVITDEIENLPADLRPYAALGFAQHPSDPKSARGKCHLRYIREKLNTVRMRELALKYPQLLQLACSRHLLKSETADELLASAQKAQNTEATAILLDYIGTKLTPKEKQQVQDKAEALEETVMRFALSVDLTKLDGNVFAVSGKLRTFKNSAELKACLEACGARLTESVSYNTDYLIICQPGGGTQKSRDARSYGVRRITEERFNEMIGRKVEDAPAPDGMV